MTVPKRGRQVKPTRSEVAMAWERIRAAADNGDVQAIAALIALGEGGSAPVHQLLPERNGVLNFRSVPTAKAITPVIAESMAGFKSAIKIRIDSGVAARINANSIDNRLRFSTDMNGVSKHKKCYAVNISLSKELMIEAGWSVGERVDLRFDPDKGVGLIVRSESDGWVISGQKTSPRSVIKFAWVQGLPTIAKTGACTGISVSEAGIMFTFPEGTDFNGNARAEQS